MRRRLLIAGPTAAGKTALAIAAADRLGGEIVNADSMQVYSGLSLITARPDDAECAAAPHHLFGTVDPSERYSVGAWARDAVAKIDEIEARGHSAILVGGTGLYFRALTVGLAEVPEIGTDARERALALESDQGLEGLRAEAERLDPVAADRVLGADRQRLLRIVEVAYETGEPLSSLQRETEPLIAPGSWTGIVIEPDREALYARINRRFDTMMEAGALEEVRAFARLDLNAALPAMKALGVPPLLAHLRGEMDLQDAIELAKRDSRRYAKRQLTWFRNQHPDWARIDTLDPASAIVQLEAIIEGETR